MIQLFVNKAEVILPADFTFTIVEENPEITDSGEFTLDMTISLREPKNAIAFKFLNRMNIASITSEAEAKMVIDDVVRSGTILISKHTDVDVTFQFIAGNTELNYIAKNEKKIWELAWGEEEDMGFSNAYASLNPVYHKNYYCVPVKIGDEVVNDYQLFNDRIVDIGEKVIMQPRILYYIRRLPELLGYTLKENVLENDERAKKMYIVNAVNSLKYADALPDMTVSEFIDAIENFFNVTFLVDKMDRTISIHNFSSNLVHKKTVNVTEVLDSYERNLSEESKSVKLDFTRVSYDLSDSIYFKYQKFNDEILAKCEIKEFANKTALINFVLGKDYRDKFCIYRDLDTGNDYVFCAPTIDNISGLWAGTYGNLRLVNKFRSYGTTSERELSLKICPAEMVIEKKLIDATYSIFLHYQLPKSSNSYYEKKYQGLVDCVENGTNDIPRQNFLETALFTGLIFPWQLGFNAVANRVKLFPYSHTDFHPDFCVEIGWENFYNWRDIYFMKNATTTMRLCGPCGIVSDYHQNSVIDTSKEYTFMLIDSPDIRANNIFIINNIRFMPIQLEREKSATSNTVKGTFYRMIEKPTPPPVEIIENTAVWSNYVDEQALEVCNVNVHINKDTGEMQLTADRNVVSVVIVVVRVQVFENMQYVRDENFELAIDMGSDTSEVKVFELPTSGTLITSVIYTVPSEDTEFEYKYNY